MISEVIGLGSDTVRLIFGIDLLRIPQLRISSSRNRERQNEHTSTFAP